MLALRSLTPSGLIRFDSAAIPNIRFSSGEQVGARSDLNLISGLPGSYSRASCNCQESMRIFRIDA